MGIKKLKADDSNTTESFKGDIPKNDIPNVHWSRRDDYENKMNWMGLDNLLKFYFEIIIILYKFIITLYKFIVTLYKMISKKIRDFCLKTQDTLPLIGSLNGQENIEEVLDKLTAIKDFLDKGLITEDEAEKKRAEILSKIK